MSKFMNIIDYMHDVIYQEPKYINMNENKYKNLYYAKIEYVIKSTRNIGSAIVIHKYNDTINMLITDDMRDYDLVKMIKERSNHSSHFVISDPVITKKTKLSDPKGVKLLTGWVRDF